MSARVSSRWFGAGRIGEWSGLVSRRAPSQPRLSRLHLRPRRKLPTVRHVTPLA